MEKPKYKIGDMIVVSCLDKKVYFQTKIKFARWEFETHWVYDIEPKMINKRIKDNVWGAENNFYEQIFVKESDILYKLN